MSVTIWLTLGGSLLASYCDVRTRRIPNWITGSLAIAAIFVHAFAGIHSVGEILAASGMLGFPLCIPFLLYTAIGGGVLAIVFIVSRGKIRATASRVMLMAMGGSRSVVAAKSETLPYAVAFASGAILIVLSQSVAPFLRISV
jgi:Flp pilus assembly protein protease CpaA